MPSSSDPRPADFDRYWVDALEELARIPPAPEPAEIPLRSTDFATMYGVRLTSIGPYRLFAYLSLPKEAAAPFPTIFYFPGYGSVVNPIPQGATHELRRRYATFSLATRGQRNADRPFAATYPGLLTMGIDDPSTYVFRGIIADCCRGVEYLLSRPEIDPERVVGIGEDLALIAAGFVDRLSHLVYSPGVLYGVAEHQEVRDYLRLRPERERDVLRTLGYFDPRRFPLPRRSRCLIVGEKDGGKMGPDGLRSLLDTLGDRAAFYETQKSAYKDGIFKDTWIAEQFGFDQPILPKAWLAMSPPL